MLLPAAVPKCLTSMRSPFAPARVSALLRQDLVDAGERVQRARGSLLPVQCSYGLFRFFDSVHNASSYRSAGRFRAKGTVQKFPDGPDIILRFQHRGEVPAGDIGDPRLVHQADKVLLHLAGEKVLIGQDEKDFPLKRREIHRR